MNSPHICILSCALLLLIGCDQIKQDESSNVVKQKLKKSAATIINKVIPQFDANTADTKFNKERFKEFLKIDLTADIKSIYCFDDRIGINADFQFSFNCNASTVAKIIEKHHLKLDTQNENLAFGLQTEFNWWQKAKIKKLKLYSWTNGQNYFKYFWYDEREKKAYFFDFDV
jgi:hypothetical protein